MKRRFCWSSMTTFLWKRSLFHLWFWERTLFRFKKVNNYISCTRVRNIVLFIGLLFEEMSWSLYVLLWFFRLMKFALGLLSFFKYSNLQFILWFAHFSLIYFLDRRHMNIFMSTKSDWNLPWIYVIFSNQTFLTHFALCFS